MRWRLSKKVIQAEINCMFIEMTLTREDKVWESIQEINNGNGPADGDILNKNTTS